MDPEMAPVTTGNSGEKTVDKSIECVLNEMTEIEGTVYMCISSVFTKGVEG